MGKSILWSVGAIVGGVGLLLSACSGTKSSPDLGTAGNASFSGGAGTAGGIDCVPGAKRCDGSVVKQCDDKGSRETVSTVCEAPQSCAGGVCLAAACAPNTQFCKDNSVWKCDQNGVSSVADKCAIGLFCREDNDTASCSAQACTPNQPVCDGDVATVCQSDGSGPATGGMDCSKTKRACYAGQCRDTTCTDGERRCDHGDLYVCSHNGTDLALLSDCRTDEVCDGDMVACRSRVCEPGKVACDGTRVQSCNEFGSAWLPGSVDCAVDGKICALGGCKKQVCTASRSFCQDNNLYSCDGTGTTTTLVQTCNAQNEHCVTYSTGSGGYCDRNKCHAGDTVCDGNVVKVCNADGSLPATGTTCTSKQYCEDAKCKDMPCTPGNYVCNNSDIYYCDFSSPFLILQQECDADTTCKISPNNGATCSPLPCKPASTACLGDKIGTCAADGQSLSAVTTDCTAATNVCTTDLKCAKSAADTIGSDGSFQVIGAGAMIGNVIDVDATRKLTELQAKLVLGGPRDLRWVVYELSGFTFTVKYDKLVSNVTGGSDFISSGALNYKLTAGKRYFLGVAITGGDVVENIDYMPYTTDVSFGTVTGQVYNSYYTTFDVSYVDPSAVAQMKVTTETP